MHILDTLLVASVQNRRAMFHYQELLAQLVGPHNNSLNSTALSILTRSALREMDSTNVLWREELDKGKPRVVLTVKSR